MKRTVTALSLVTLIAAPALAAAETLHANLTGYQEVPAVSTGASGEFRAKLNEAAGTIDYDLTYDGLESPVRMSHIHVAQPGVNGGISVWLCQTAAFPAPAPVFAVTPVCPQAGTVSGTITAAQVIGPVPQLIVATQLDELIRAIRAGVTYVNIHSDGVPGGEIRGLLRR